MKKIKLIIKKINNTENRKEYECYLLKKIFKKKYGLKETEIGYTKNGKPYLKNSKNIHFSISHSKDILVIAISNENIGVDIEKIKDYPKKMHDIINYYPKNKKDFFKEWTKREAVIKLKDLTLKDINFLNYTGINFKTKKYKKHIITIAYEI